MDEKAKNGRNEPKRKSVDENANKKAPNQTPTEGKKKSKGKKKKETHEAAMIKVGVEVAPMVYMRLGKDRKISFNMATKDFIEHLENPSPGALTGGQLPYTPLTMMRIYRRSLMNRVMACGPSKDPILHWGLPPTKTILPAAIPFSLNVVILLVIPVAPQMSTKDRELLQLLQVIAKHHHSGYSDEFEGIVDEMTRLSEILEKRSNSSLRSMILSALMVKKNLSSKSQKVLFDALSDEIEIDREQITAVISALRNRDQLSRDQGNKIREDLSIALHDRRNGKIRASELIRKIVKVKNV